MNNKVLKTFELLIGLNDGTIEKSAVSDFFREHSDHINRDKENPIDMLKNGMDIFSEIIVKLYLNQNTCPSKANKTKDTEDCILSRKQAVEKYEINEGTFDRWRKNGLKTSTPGGGRLVFVRKSELENFMLNLGVN